MSSAKFKKLVKAAAGRAVLRLPWGLRESLFQSLCSARAASIFSDMAATLNVVAVTVRGEYGDVQGSPYDTSILPVYATTGRWANRTNALLWHFFEQSGGGTYIDIGANIGLTTIPIARNPRIACLAIEPESTNYRHLVANVTANCPHGNVRTKHLAVFSRAATLVLEIATGNLGDHRLRLTAAPGLRREERREAIAVEALPLDAIASEVRGPLAVKVDTQGAEPFVVEGGRHTLAMAKLLIIEFSPYAMARMGADPEIVLQFLESHFRHATIVPLETEDMPAPKPAVEIAQALRQMAQSRRGDPDYYVDIIATNSS